MVERKGRLERWWAAAARRPKAAAAVIAGVAGVILLAVLAAGGPWGGRRDVVTQSLVVQPRPLVSTIALAGMIAPADDVAITSPLEGVVRQVGFAYGDTVAEGQLLVALDPADAVQRRNEAEAEFLKAAQARSEMASWITGPDVSRDRRAATAAALALAATQRRARETGALLNRGLVPRDEYEGVLEEERNQEMALAAARQDLATTLRQGAGANRRAADLEFQNARARLTDLDAQLAGAMVRAPAAGVMARPPADKAENPGAVHIGLQLAKGQLIGSIVRPGGLAVIIHLSEADADKVRPGQPVTVTGPGFPALTLHGRMVSVAGEASPSAAANGPLASFAATARLTDLSPDEARIVRIGMTAEVVVETHRADRALVVPPAAIQGDAAAPSVLVRDQRTGRPRPAPVRLGQIASDGVEVVSGLRAGDTVVWSAPKPSVTAGAPPA